MSRDGSLSLQRGRRGAMVELTKKGETQRGGGYPGRAAGGGATVPATRENLTPPGTVAGSREVSSLDSAREGKLQEALRQLLEKSEDIEAAAVVSMDGFMMASALPAGYDEDRLGAMSAALLSLGERTALELGRGELAQVFVEGTQGYVFLLAAGEDAVLSAIVRRGSKLGLVLYDIRNAAKNVEGIIESHLQVEYE